MGKAGAEFFGMDPEVLITLEESITGMTKVVSTVSLDNGNGPYILYGTMLPRVGILTCV